MEKAQKNFKIKKCKKKKKAGAIKLEKNCF
jgi:hypothetical protein